MSRIKDVAALIRYHEGWFPGSRSERNNNPGNFKFYYGGYRPLYGKVTKDKDGFAVFKDLATGWLYLNNFLTNAFTGKSARYSPEMTLQQFFKSYCEDDPRTPENDPEVYAKVVADGLGVDTLTQIKTLA